MPPKPLKSRLKGKKRQKVAEKRQKKCVKCLSKGGKKANFSTEKPNISYHIDHFEFSSTLASHTIIAFF
ncbi:MAG: hypothetical protein RSD04_04635 [Clostridia bacterium]